MHSAAVHCESRSIICFITREILKLYITLATVQNEHKDLNDSRG